VAEAKLSRQGFRLVAELVKMHPIPFTTSVVGSAVFAGATVASTVVLGKVTDQVVLPTFETGQVPDGSLRLGVAAVLVVAALRAVGVVFRRYFAAMTAERVMRSLRHRLVDQYLALPLAWHQRVPAGQLLAHADNDTEVTADLLLPLPFSLGVGFLALFSAVAIVTVDPVLAAVALAVFPTLAVLNRFYSSRVERPAAEVQEAVGEVASIAHESFDGALVVKTLGRTGAESERFEAAARELQRRRRRIGYIRAGFDVAIEALPTLGIVLVVVVGAFRIRSGAMTQGDLVQVASLFTLLALPMRVFGFFLETVPPSVASRARLDTVYREPLPPVADTIHPLPPGGLGAGMERLWFEYEPGEPVLRGIDLDVQPGEVVALVGSTGSGKSTLCTLLAGLLPPTTGTVRIGGVPVTHIDPMERVGAVALVFQESFLFADTVAANVDLTGRADPEELATAVRVAQVDRFLDDLADGIGTVIGERGVTLSGGQRQRVALARALLHRPRLLLLDDATSAVDPIVEQQILDGLRADLDATTVIVAQRVSTIELADRVVHLCDGRVANQGTHAELLADPAYEALVTAYEERAS
jgi:ABC-type multidrug transport system fused ATPase/permease subunit